MKLLIRNLSRSTTENQIHKMFEEFGKVSTCNLVLDQTTGKSKGFAFVEMADDEQATRAMKALHEMMVAKISKIKPVRSITRHLHNCSRFRSWAGEREWLKITISAPVS